MKLGDLQIFVDIVEAGGLTAAAHRRGVTQPAISRALRDMETRLQAQLLTRTGRGIELTPAGTEFLSFATETLDRFAQTRRKIIDSAHSLPSQLKLSVPLRLGRLLIPALYREFSVELPDTAVQFFEEHSDRARQMLASGDLDAAVTYSQNLKADRDFVPLFTEDLYAVGNRAILGNSTTAITAQAVSHLPLLLPSSGRYRDLIETAFRSAGLQPHIVRELETAEGLLAFAAEGDGIAILPFSNVSQEVARHEVTARPISGPAISRSVGLRLGSGLSRIATGTVVTVTRRVLQAAAHDARWHKPGSTG